MLKKFYVYVQCRPSGEPFNVGKGCAKRGYDFKHNRNQHFKNVIRKHGAANIGVYVRNCKSEKQAHQHEIWMIAYGRAQGWRLCNQTDGGDGISGYKFSTEEKKTNSKRIKILWQSAAYRSKLHTPEHNNKISIGLHGNVCALGNIRSNKVRVKDSIAAKLRWSSLVYRHKIESREAWNKGTPHTEEHRQKLCGRKPWNKDKLLTESHRASLRAAWAIRKLRLVERIV